MEKILNDLVAQCCDKAINECNEYLQKEHSGEYSEEELSYLREILIYKRAVKDTIKILHYFNII